MRDGDEEAVNLEEGFYWKLEMAQIKCKYTT